MLKNRVLLVTIIACTVFLFAVVLPQKSISSSTPDKIVIDNQYKKKTRGPLPFNHGDHIKYGIACAECHHVYKDGKNVWKEGDPVQKCSACHDSEKKQGNAPALKNAFHSQCQDCHKNVNDEAKAPIKKCNSCHKK